jgi:hypothetical protein
MSQTPDLLADLVGSAIAAFIGWAVAASFNRQFAPLGALAGFVVKESIVPAATRWASQHGL